MIDLHGFGHLLLAGTCYITLIRGIPELLIVFAIYFGGTALVMSVVSIFGYDEYIEVDPFMAGSAVGMR